MAKHHSLLFCALTNINTTQFIRTLMNNIKAQTTSNFE